MLHSLEIYKKSKMSDEDDDSSVAKKGLSETQTFPNLPLLNSSGTLVNLHSLIHRRTALVMQPGTSHTDQWKDRADALTLWKSIPGAAGCTDQLLNYVAHCKDFEDAESDIIIILSNKTPANLLDIMEKKNVPFQIYTLSPEAISMLQGANHPFFEFQSNLYPQRETFLLDEDYHVQKVMGRKLDSPDQCKDEAQRTLEECKKCKKQPSL